MEQKTKMYFIPLGTEGENMVQNVLINSEEYWGGICVVVVDGSGSNEIDCVCVSYQERTRAGAFRLVHDRVQILCVSGLSV
jgi:hypothetical protein